MSIDKFIEDLTSYPWNDKGIIQKVKQKKKEIIFKCTSNRFKELLKPIFNFPSNFTFDYDGNKEKNCSCCGRNENCGIDDYETLGITFYSKPESSLKDDEEKVENTILLIYYEYQIDHVVNNRGYNVNRNDRYLLIYNDMAINNSIYGGEILNIGSYQNLTFEWENVEEKDVNKLNEHLNNHYSIINYCNENAIEENWEDDDWVEINAKCFICDEYYGDESIFNEELLKKIDFLTKYSLIKDITLKIFSARKDIKKLFNNHPIMYVQKICLLPMLAKRFDPASVFAILPLDVLKLISQMVWSTRHNNGLWIKF